MNHNKNYGLLAQVYLGIFLGIILLLFAPSDGHAQQQVILPSDGSFSAEHSPQGGLRYHRQLYLITAQELASSNLQSGTDLNSIGFTIAAAQDTSTIAAFDVYLENTTDEESRTDTAWTMVPASSANLMLENLSAGEYEWQVQAECSPASSYSPIVEFSTDNLGGCNQPINLMETGITATSATLQWYAPESPNFIHFKIEYKSVLDPNWIELITTNSSIILSGLNSSINYQWRVRAFCAADSSELSGSSFATLNVNNCNPPSNLMVTSTTNTSAQLDWTAASGASRYDVRFRRVGTDFWLSALAFTNSYNLTFGLVAGTTYEWEIRTVCAAGSGHYIHSSGNITTTGSLVCYPPTNLSINNVSDTTITLNWMASAGAASYMVRYRLKNSISWTNAVAGMTQVHNDSVLVPSTIGNFAIPFSMGAPFTYTGGGLYVAFEYANDTIQLSTFNNSLATKKNSGIVDQNGADSAQVDLCLNASSNSALPNFLTTTKTRPQTLFGSASFVDSVAIEAVYGLGYYALNFSGMTPVSALVSNFANEQRNYCIDFEVVEKQSGAQRYFETKCLDIAADTSVLVTFTDYVPGILETDSLIMSVQGLPSENILDNNKAFYLQRVNATKIGYDDGSERVTHAGFADTAGLILTKYSVIGCGQINSTEIYLDYTAAGHSIYAVILDGAGVLLDSSDVFIPTSEEVNKYHTFYFSDAPYIGVNEFYVGLAQTADPGNPYFPVGVQYETAFVREGAYYRDSIGGMHLMDMPLPGRLMIRANIVSGASVPTIEGDLSLCSGATNILTIASSTQRFANQVLGFSSQVSTQAYSATQALGSPNVYPTYGASTMAWISATPDDQREYLELAYSVALPINYIDIYETFNPGAVDTVYVRNAMGVWVMVYTNPAAAEPAIARVNRIDFAMTAFDVSAIRIALASNTVPGYQAIDAVAIGQRTSPGVFSSYLWSPNGETTNSVNVSAPGTYAVTVTDGSGCENSTSVEVVAPPQTIPMISVASGDDTTFCQGDSVTLISNQTSGNTWSTMETTQSITVHTSGSYTVSYNDGSGCGAAASDPVQVTVNPLPTPAITGSLGFCPAGSTTLDAGASYTSFLWSTGETTRMISVDVADLFSVLVTNANGCKASTSATTFIQTPPSPAISGNLSFCPGASTTLDAGAGYAAYAWSTGATTRTTNISTAMTVSVTVTDANGCTGSTSVSTSEYTPPSPSISGDLDFCLGESTTLNAGSYAGYLWSTGATSQTINVTSADSYDVTVTDANGCTGTTGVVVTVNIPPTPVISGSFSFCGGSSTTLDAGPGYNNYLWSTGAIAQQITVVDTATYSVTVTDANGCTGTASATTTMEGSIPQSPGPISGPTEGLCNATNVFYSIDPVPNASFYVWTVPDSVDILSGQGTVEILVNFGNGFPSGDIVVAASNACGQSPSIDPTFITIHTGPGQAGAITGPATGLCNQSAVGYSINPVAGPATYNWTVPTGSVITSGQGTPSIVMTLGSSGNICVTTTNACGTAPASCIAVTTTDFSVNAGNCKQVIPNLPPLDCVELTAVTNGGVGPFVYTWTSMGGFVIGTTQSVTVCPGLNATYTVTVEDASGCIAVSDVDVFIADAICRSTRAEVCHVATNRTKCLKTNQVQSHLNHGDYLGSCNDVNPCGNGSGSGSVVVGDEILEIKTFNEIADVEEPRLSIFPNPATTDVVLEFYADMKESVTIDFVDVYQQNVKTIKIVGRGHMEVEVDLSDFVAGVYFVNVRMSNELFSKTLIVQRK